MQLYLPIPSRWEDVYKYNTWVHGDYDYTLKMFKLQMDPNSHVCPKLAWLCMSKVASRKGLLLW
jgi:hypothetical protein